jgi:hypothetical protein
MATIDAHSANDGYSYDHLGAKTLLQDMYFRRSAPNPGDPFPGFDLPTTDGERLSSAEIIGKRPMLLVTGSFTCPMTASSNPILKQLHAEYGSEVQFVMLHVREAHPGERRPQPHSFDEKLDHARELKKRDELPFPVVVDDPAGTTHRNLDQKPNSAWLIDRHGRIAFRALWAADEKPLRQALDAVIGGERLRKPESTHRLMPMAMGVGMMQDMLRRSGPQAQRDIIRAAPPMAAMAWVADRFRPLDAKWRGLAAMATVMGVGAAAVAAIARR